MRDALSNVVAPHQIYCLFALLLIHCDIPDEVAFYKEHKTALIDNDLSISTEEELLQKLAQVFDDMGTPLSTFTLLPQPEDGWDDPSADTDEPLLPHDVAATLDTRIQSLTVQQRAVYNTISDVCLALAQPNYVPSNHVFFVDGPGGSGKTYVIQTTIDSLERQELGVIVVASSGIASLCLRNGATAHSTFKIPLNAGPTSTCSVSPNSDIGKKIRRASLIVWDEAPMHTKHVFEAVDRTLRDLRKLDNPLNGNLDFGGVPFVLAGDFRQILPVVKRASPSQIVAKSLKFASFWSRVTTLGLTENLRLGSGQGVWENHLLAVGEGRVPLDEDGELPFDPQTAVVNSVDRLIDEVFGDLSSQDNFKARAILSSTNAHVDAINDTVVARMTTDERTYLSIDELPPNETTLVPTEYLNTLRFGGMAPHKLTLKLGCVVMCLRNLDRHNGLLNGTRLK
ncbi:MAG: hypothetical protein WBB82_13040, partial [Limnothrix sp.]